jgi:hypothetical protein
MKRATRLVLLVGVLAGSVLGGGVLGGGVVAAQGGADKGGADKAPASPTASPSPTTSTTTPTATGGGASDRVVTSVTPTTLSVGEVARVRLEVTAPASVEVSLPDQSFGGLELADRKVSTTIADGVSKTVYELELLALEPGEVELPALTVRTVGANGELGSASGAAKKLTVRSLIANEPNAEPKPPTKPLSVMHDDYTLAWIALGLVAIALIALATLRVSRYLKQRPKPVAPAPPPRPPWELAIAKLERLAQQRDQMFAEQRSEEFIDGVSDALREYLGRRYGFDGLESTTGELLGTLERLRPNKLSLSGVSLLLEQCDLVKFARAKPEPEQCQDLWNGALGLIRATAEQPRSLAPPPQAVEVQR